MAKFTEDNRKFFDDLAAKYDVPPWVQEMAAKITAFIQQQIEFIGINQSTDREDISLLDYACGTGVLSRALGPYVNSIQAIDLSANMVARYKDLAASSSIASVKNAVARVGDLITEEEPPAELSGSDLQGFSVAAVTAGVHHFADPALAIRRLAGRLRPGGVLAIIDFVEEATHSPSSASPAAHTISKHGFGEQEMKEMMEKAGLVDFGWKEMPGKVGMRMHEDNLVYRTVFLARAIRKEA